MTNHPPNPTPLRILHLEDSPLDHALVKRELQRSGGVTEVERVDTLDAFAQALEQCTFDVILADYRLPGFTALDAWQVMQQKQLKTPVVLLSGAIGESAAVAAIKVGISDYLPKEDIGKLGRVLERAIEMHRIQLEKEAADVELAQSEKRLASFAEYLQSTIEKERAAIAREIHDDIGGSLAAVRFDLSWISRHSSDPATQSHLSAASDMLTHALEASQRIMMNLRPAVLDQGLVAAVNWLATSFTKRTGLPATVRAPQKIEGLPKSVQLTAYRTTQEALTNIGKYAQCTQVKIELSDAEGVLTLEVTDDGLGITSEDLAKASSFGIRGLKERARTVGGWLDVSSQPGHGTAIILSVPLTKSTAYDTGDSDT
ncbi:MAG: response regulator [Rhodoferax sp.]|uniref:hybrid sensor histidine kinase/response regulator n=1 Tax=Rhodoferax sp. TaxID=50421 RepID=UPI00261AD915|nr:response regulator [Rhodoferax sp.]MDD2881944.1 response regulator [Rhodoferax sp.]